MKALVTGASGFIGSHLCEELVKQGYKVTCLLRDASSTKWIENLDLELIKGDCTDIDSLKRLAGGFDYVFHLAGLTKSCSENDFFCINTRGTENLIRAVFEKKLKPKRFLYLSSLSATGPSKTGIPLSEEMIPSPVSNYGKSKLEAERAILKYKDIIPFTILRPPAVYGPRDKDMLVFFKMLKKGIFPVWGKSYYSLLYIDDLIRGIILAAESPLAEGKTYFLSDNKFYTGEEIVSEISSSLGVRVTKLKMPKFVMPIFGFLGEKLNKKGIINRDKIKELSHSHWICDSQKAKEEIGFKTRVAIKEGIKWTADWYRIHRWL